jgi:hypothetical protein
MTVDPIVVGLFGTALVALQSWTLMEVVKLKVQVAVLNVQVAVLNQRVENLPCHGGGANCEKGKS